ncbi:MAG: SDR family oxidoreductase [Planctomycetota bacterium]
MPRIDLAGKPICITGGSSGIGAATALACAQAGMPVVIGARREDRLAEVARRVQDAGGRCVFQVCDVESKESCAALVRRTIDEFGSIYSVFANAGYGYEQAVHEDSEDALRKIFEVNFWGSLNVIEPALPHMRAAKAGHVLWCSSCLARFVLPFYSAYSATKAAQHHLGRAMNMELRREGIASSTVHPVTTSTEFFDTANKHSGKGVTDHTPKGFMQKPKVVANAIVRCLRSPKPEVWTSHSARIGMALCAAFPSWGEWGVRGMVRKREAASA